MKLSKLYCSDEELFLPVEFNAGLNVIRAEIRLPENKKKDTHNLGKTTFGRLIDFCLLCGTDKNFFLNKHHDIFSELTFFLELRLSNSEYVTIRRSALNQTRISFKRHETGFSDFRFLQSDEWDHYDQPFRKSREILDAILDLADVKPWSYRKGLGFQLRNQEDYRDVFQLRRFAGAHSDWKPYVAHILGLSSDLIQEQYAQEKDIEQLSHRISDVQMDLSPSIRDVSKLEGLLLLKSQEVDERRAALESLDFRAQDSRVNQEVVDRYDREIATLNEQQYALTYNIAKVKRSLEKSDVRFDVEETERLFQEVGVLFKGQVKREFFQLVEFHRAIATERSQYLITELVQLETSLSAVDQELRQLQSLRASALSFLAESDSYQKLLVLTDELVVARSDLNGLERQRGSVQQLQRLRGELRTKTEEHNQVADRVEANLGLQSMDPQSLLSAIRIAFSNVVDRVVDHKALIDVRINENRHLEFGAEILGDLDTVTSAERGQSYKRLLCIAFDLALVDAHLEGRFPQFVYHDGVLEALDDRKKINLIEEMRRLSRKGVQQIITLIDSDEPYQGTKPSVFDSHEIILRLHDEGDDGRLFRMPPW